MKPWGTAHAVLSCIDQVNGPFAVINADDYYGVEAFQLIYDYLTTHQDDDKFRYTMVGYILGNTVTDNGHVSRGVCTTNDQHELGRGYLSVSKIEKRNGGIAFTEDDGETWTELPGRYDRIYEYVGFTRSILVRLRQDSQHSWTRASKRIR